MGKHSSALVALSSLTATAGSRRVAVGVNMVSLDAQPNVCSVEANGIGIDKSVTKTSGEGCIILIVDLINDCIIGQSSPPFYLKVGKSGLALRVLDLHPNTQPSVSGCLRDIQLNILPFQLLA